MLHHSPLAAHYINSNDHKIIGCAINQCCNGQQTLTGWKHIKNEHGFDGESLADIKWKPLQ